MASVVLAMARARRARLDAIGRCEAIADAAAELDDLASSIGDPEVAERAAVLAEQLRRISHG